MKKYGGLIRWKFFIPLAASLAALVIYAFLLLDQHLKSLMESFATRANGAEVNIGSVKTSISGLFVEIQKIQLTDPEAPESNRLEVAKIRLDLGAKGLLRGKLVVEDASLLDLQIQSKRSQPGLVLPPPRPEPEGPGLKAEALVLLQPIKDEVMGNALSVLKEQGFGNPLEGIQWDELPSSQAIKQLEGDWNQRQETIQSMFASLPNPAELSQIRAEISSIKMPDDPTQIASRMASLDALKDRVQGDFARIETAAQQLKSEATQFTSRIGGLDELVKQDIAVLSQKLKLPDLDFKNLAEELCGPEIKRYIKLFEVYYAKIKPYLESQEKPAPAPPLRRSGVDFSFPETNGLPGFWLKKMQISSKETAEGPLGDLLGKVTDFSSAPELVKKPTQIQLEGGFKQMGIQGLNAEAILDHRQAISRDEFKIAIAAFPIADRMLAQSKDYALGFYKAEGSLQMKFLMDGDNLKLELNSLMKQLSWKVEADSERVKNLMDSVFAPMNEVRINAKADGTLQDLQWKITSNLVDQLRASLRSALSKQIAELEDKLKEELTKRLTEEKSKLEARVREQIKLWEDKISPIQQEADGASSQIDSQKNQLQAMVDGKKAELQQKAEAEKQAAIDKANEEKKKQEEKAKEQLKNKIKVPGFGK